MAGFTSVSIGLEAGLVQQLIWVRWHRENSLLLLEFTPSVPACDELLYCSANMLTPKPRSHPHMCKQK